MSDNISKMPLRDDINGGYSNHRADEPIIKVQPPRLQDLQPSYAQTLAPDSQDASQTGESCALRSSQAFATDEAGQDGMAP